MVMTAYVATATQIILPYLPTVHPSSAQFLRSARFPAPVDGISICSAVFAGLTHVPNTQTDYGTCERCGITNRIC